MLGDPGLILGGSGSHDRIKDSNANMNVVNTVFYDSVHIGPAWLLQHSPSLVLEQSFFFFPASQLNHAEYSVCLAAQLAKQTGRTVATFLCLI